MHRFTPTHLILITAALGALAMFLLPPSISWTGLVLMVGSVGAMTTHAWFHSRPVTYRHPLITLLVSVALFLGMYAFQAAAPLFLLLSITGVGSTAYLAARWQTSPLTTNEEGHRA